MDILTIILIVFIIILIGLIFKLIFMKNKIDENYRIDGGQGFLTTSPGFEQILSFSEIVLDEIINEKYPNSELIENKFKDGIFLINNFKDILKKSIEQFLKFSHIQYQKKQRLITSNVKCQYISDAFLDSILLMNYDLGIDEIICKCEFPTDIFHNVDNYRKPMSFPTENSQFTYIIDGFYARNSNSAFLIKSVKNNYLLLSKNDLNHSTIWNSNHLNVIPVFLEFTYQDDFPKNRVFDLYNNIHQITGREISNIIFDHSQDPIGNANKFIYIKRFEMISNCNHVATNLRVNRYPVGNNVTIIKNYWNPPQYKTIVIPDSTTHLYADELIVIKHRNNLFIVQVEHSEGFGNHKSNLIEFLLTSSRNFGIDTNSLFEFMLKTEMVELLSNGKFATSKKIRNSIFRNSYPIFYDSFIY